MLCKSVLLGIYKLISFAVMGNISDNCTCHHHTYTGPNCAIKVVAGAFPDSKVHGVNMGPIWGRLDPGRSHVGPMNLAIWVNNNSVGPPAGTEMTTKTHFNTLYWYWLDDFEYRWVFLFVCLFFKYFTLSFKLVVKYGLVMFQRCQCIKKT